MKLTRKIVEDLLAVAENSRGALVEVDVLSLVALCERALHSLEQEVADSDTELLVIYVREDVNAGEITLPKEEFHKLLRKFGRMKQHEQKPRT